MPSGILLPNINIPFVYESASNKLVFFTTGLGALCSGVFGNMYVYSIVPANPTSITNAIGAFQGVQAFKNPSGMGLPALGGGYARPVDMIISYLSGAKSVNSKYVISMVYYEKKYEFRL